MNGDLNKIRIVGLYFIEVWKSIGMKLNNVKFIWASDYINKKPSEYWLKVIDISKQYTISRIKRCS